jgi:CRP-like cAMP-binding protein
LSDADLLQKHGWLAGRSQASQRRILSCGRPRHFAKDEALYHFGDSSRGVYGIVAGNVSVSIPNDVGAAQTVYLATPGFWIGDAALFSDQTRLVTVIAETEVDALFLPKAQLDDLVREHPDLLRDFYALSHLNLNVALSLIANLVTPNAAQRLAAFLLNVDERQVNPGDWIQVAQDRLASMVALSTPTVQRHLRNLSAAGLVEIGYGRMRVIERAALRRFLME